jgi:hypothetical protein
MPTQSDSGELKLCANCIGDKDFAKWIRAHGRRGKCDFDKSHGKSRKVVSVSNFAEEVDRYFRENYGHGEEYMYATGDSDRAASRFRLSRLSCRVFFPVSGIGAHADQCGFRNFMRECDLDTQRRRGTKIPSSITSMRSSR